jgi:hypothetical protein
MVGLLPQCRNHLLVCSDETHPFILKLGDLGIYCLAVLLFPQFLAFSLSNIQSKQRREYFL